MINKHGYMVGGSLRLMNLDGKLHLLCKGVIISPVAKYNYINGLWREVSPTIRANYALREISFVPVPAQLNNSSLSSGEAVLGENVEVNNLDQIIEAAKRKAEEEAQLNKIKSKEYVAESLTEKLINSGVITSSTRSAVREALIQLSSGEEPLVANLLNKVANKSAFANRS